WAPASTRSASTTSTNPSTTARTPTRRSRGSPASRTSTPCSRASNRPPATRWWGGCATCSPNLTAPSVGSSSTGARGWSARSVGLVVQRDDLLLRRRLRIEAGAAAVERRLGHVLDDALEVLALDARPRERRDVEVGVERLELVDDALAC